MKTIEELGYVKIRDEYYHETVGEDFTYKLEKERIIVYSEKKNPQITICVYPDSGRVEKGFGVRLRIPLQVTEEEKAALSAINGEHK